MADKFEKLIEQAAAIEIERRQFEAGDQNLSCEAYVRESLNVDGANLDEVKIVEKAMMSPQNEVLRGALTRLCHNLVERFARTSPPPAKYLMNYIGDEAGHCLARLRVSPQSFFVAVAKDLTKRKPQLFGKANSINERAEKETKFRAELERLYVEIEKSWERGDVTVHRHPSTADGDRLNGLSRVSFKCTGDAVALIDGDRLGERLTMWWVDHADQRKRAA